MDIRKIRNEFSHLYPILFIPRTHFRSMQSLSGRPPPRSSKRLVNRNGNQGGVAPKNYRGIGLNARYGVSRGRLPNPQERLTMMKSLLSKDHEMGERKRLQLAERIILATFQISRFINNSRVSSDVLSGQTIGRSHPDLYNRALANLIRKEKIRRSSPSEFTRI